MSKQTEKKKSWLVRSSRCMRSLFTSDTAILRRSPALSNKAIPPSPSSFFSPHKQHTLCMSEGLLAAVKEGNQAKALQILNGGKAQINARDEGGRTALMYAAILGNEKLAILLMSQGADLNLQDGQSQTAMLLALKERQYEVARALLSSGTDSKSNGKSTAVDVTLADVFGRVPLMFAAQNGYEDLLIQCMVGVDIDSRTQSGDTALHWSASQGRTSCVELLLRKGANPSAKNVREESPLDVASTSKIRQVLQDRVSELQAAVQSEKKQEIVAELHVDVSAAPAAVPSKKTVEKKKMTITLKPREKKPS